MKSWIPLLLLVAATALGAESSKPMSPRPKSGAVLDFEADVIEGEKRKPDLFLQMEGGAASMESILYSRDDFNDFKEVDQKMRPKVYKSKSGGVRKP